MHLRFRTDRVETKMKAFRISIAPIVLVAIQLGGCGDFAIPEGFARDFEKDFDAPCPNPPKKVLVELERYSKQRGLDDLSQWLKGQM